MKTFWTLWAGQTVSMIGSGMTAFALGVWVYNTTGSSTLFALMAVAASLPATLLTPVAGALVDRYDRRLMMIVSDTGAAIPTLALVWLLWSDSLELWHVYPIAAIAATFNAIQSPAFGSTITLLVPKKNLGRANGMVQLGESGSQILAPLVAGFLVVSVGLKGVVIADLATFAAAILVFALITVPRPPKSAAGAAGRGNLWREAIYGWSYIKQRPGLVALLVYFALLNLVVPMAMLLATPMILSFATARELGIVLAIAPLGAIAGGIIMGAWGGPSRRILGILGTGPVVTLGLLVAGVRPSVPLIATGLFLVLFTLPIANACSQSIWQTKVEPDVQGRVFAMRRAVAQFTAPIAFLLAGPLAEVVFNPLLVEGGALADSVGRWLGTGPGRGIGLLYMSLGALFLLVTLWGSTFPRLKGVEDDLPDVVPDAPPEAAAPVPAGPPPESPGESPAAAGNPGGV